MGVVMVVHLRRWMKRLGIHTRTHANNPLSHPHRIASTYVGRGHARRSSRGRSAMYRSLEERQSVSKGGGGSFRDPKWIKSVIGIHVRASQSCIRDGMSTR